MTLVSVAIYFGSMYWPFVVSSLCSLFEAILRTFGAVTSQLPWLVCFVAVNCRFIANVDRLQMFRFFTSTFVCHARAKNLLDLSSHTASIVHA